jgi:FMN phosphatase YigB (HAD superfamily)
MCLNCGGRLPHPYVVLVQAVHIGDSLGADIQGGINAGLGATIWVNPLGKPLPRGAPKPTFTVQHVAELLGVLDQLASTTNGD